MTAYIMALQSERDTNLHIHGPCIHRNYKEETTANIGIKLLNDKQLRNTVVENKGVPSLTHLVTYTLLTSF
jgi:hypothetical protein